MSEGILYIATGEQYIDEAVVSAKSARSQMPETPITLVTDRDPGVEVFDEVVEIDEPAYSFADNITYITESPYDKTLFLDSDTYVCRDISDVFDLLGRFDVAATHDSGRRYELDQETDIEVRAPECFPMYNSGVIAFSNTETTKQLFEKWDSVYQRHSKHQPGIFNQPAFREALFRTDLAIATLPPEYNCRLPYPPYLRGEVKLLHGRASDFEAIEAILNRTLSSERRTFLALAGRENPRIIRLNLDKWQHRQRRLYESLSDRGVLGTVAGVVRWFRGGEF